MTKSFVSSVFSIHWAIMLQHWLDNSSIIRLVDGTTYIDTLE